MALLAPSSVLPAALNETPGSKACVPASPEASEVPDTTPQGPIVGRNEQSHQGLEHTSKWQFLEIGDPVWGSSYYEGSH